MIHNERLTIPRHIYPADPWRLVETKFNPSWLPQAETHFSTANGYLGIRGSFEEGAPVYQRGTWINGFYETWPIVYGEKAYGFATTGQTMIEVTDSAIIRLFVDDEPLYLPSANLLKYERALNMKTGTLDRELVWETPSGKLVSVRLRRLVSFPHRHLAALSYEVTLLNAAAPVVLSSEPRHRSLRPPPRPTHSSAHRPTQPRSHRARHHRAGPCLLQYHRW